MPRPRTTSRSDPPAPARAVIRVRVQPRASRDELAGWRDDTLRVRVTAPPLDGRANAALRALIADAAGVPTSAVGIVGGERGRDKLVSVAGLTPAALRARLA